jgi:putative endonuclease
MVITSLKMIKLPEGIKPVEYPEHSREACRERSREVEGLSWVYILYCQNGTLYVGQTHDVKQRLSRHADGYGGRHTRLLKDFILIYSEGPMDSGAALKRERQLKKWSRAKKLALVRGDREELKRLSRSRD